MPGKWNSVQSRHQDIIPFSHVPPWVKKSRLRHSTSATSSTSRVASREQEKRGFTSGISQIEASLNRCFDTHACGSMNHTPGVFLEYATAANI